MYYPKKWNIKETDRALVDKIAGEMNILEITAGILVNRGIESVEKAEAFLNPDITSLYDPYLLPDMKKGV